MTKNLSEIYHFIGNVLSSNTEGDWKETLLNIEVLEGYCSYEASYVTTDNVTKDMDVFEFPDNFGDNLMAIHKVTTEGGTNRWNRAVFKLWPDGKFDMEFIWDQELHDEIARLNKE